jgi:hypothetical protein
MLRGFTDTPIYEECAENVIFILPMPMSYPYFLTYALPCLASYNAFPHAVDCRSLPREEQQSNEIKINKSSDHTWTGLYGPTLCRSGCNHKRKTIDQPAKLLERLSKVWLPVSILLWPKNAGLNRV